MKQKHSYISIILAVTIILASTACGKPADTPSGDTPGTEVTTTPAVTPGTDKKTTYTVVPLTTGKTSPIAATSYDLLHTVTTISLYDSYDYDILNGCFELIDYYEKLLSRSIKGSDIYELNHIDGTSFTVSEKTRDLIELSLYYAELTGGALDISIAPVSTLWDFAAPGHFSSVPDAKLIEEALSLVDYSAVHLDGNTVSFDKQGMQLELGAVAKGYIADRVKDYLLENGVKSAIIDLGGNILLVGEKPDGSAFNVGIQKPFEDRASELVAISQLKDMSMVSSGIYEHYFYDENEIFYHHILNPETGYPFDSNLLQVTIISKESAVGDALSTSCFALGLEKGLELINSLEDVYAVFMTTDNELHFSDGYLETFPTTSME